MPRTIKLYPVRESESDNFNHKWRRRTQVLGSVLHWAHDANATRVVFNPKIDEPFACFADDGKIVATEVGPTPTEHLETISQFIRDTVDGHPLIRPFRRLMRNLTNSQISVNIEIPPTTRYSGSMWFCSMHEDVATFLKLSCLPALQNAG